MATKETKIYMNADDVKSALAEAVNAEIDSIDTIQKRKDGGCVIIIKEEI